jgi:hypothetical protein
MTRIVPDFQSTDSFQFHHMYWDRIPLERNAGWLANRPKDRLLILLYIQKSIVAVLAVQSPRSTVVRLDQAISTP